MLCWSKPDKDTVEKFIVDQAAQGFSHPHVRCTRLTDTREELEAALGDDKNSYDVDHRREQIGVGGDMFRKAIEALEKWQHFSMEWTQVFPPEAPLIEGTTVAIQILNMGFYSLNACRIVYVIDEVEEDVRHRFGFAYGTLPKHLVSGEERFLVEWNLKDDCVYFDILSFSQPQHLMAKVGYPVARLFQDFYGTEATLMMLQAVNKQPEEEEDV